MRSLLLVVISLSCVGAPDVTSHGPPLDAGPETPIAVELSYLPDPNTPHSCYGDHGSCFLRPVLTLQDVRFYLAQLPMHPADLGCEHPGCVVTWHDRAVQIDCATFGCLCKTYAPCACVIPYRASFDEPCTLFFP